MSYTAEELAALSETEREALAAVDPDDDENLEDDGEDDEADDDQDDEEAGEEETDVKPAGDDKEADEVIAPDVNADVNADEFDLDSVPDVSFAPKLSGEILPAYEEKISELDAKLDEGEISVSEHRKEVRKLEAQSQNEEIAAQLWKAEQATFLKLNKQFVQAKNPEEFAKLNKEVMKIANDPATKGLSGIQILCLAKFNLDEAVAFAEFKSSRKSGKAPEVKKVAGKPSAAKPNIQTLRNVPAADVSDVGQDKYSHLDKLSGMALEKAIAKMSPADYAAYVQGA